MILFGLLLVKLSTYMNAFIINYDMHFFFESSW